MCQKPARQQGLRLDKLRSKMPSELGKESWSVFSDRGLEASGLVHEDARRLVHRLAGEGRHGLCIVTDEAASRIASSELPNILNKL